MPATPPREALSVNLARGRSNTLVRVGAAACARVRAEAAERGCAITDVVRDAVAPLAEAFGDTDLAALPLTCGALDASYAEVLRLAVLARVEPRLAQAMGGTTGAASPASSSPSTTATW